MNALFFFDLFMIYIPESGILNIVNRSSKAKTHGSLSGTKIKIFLKYNKKFNWAGNIRDILCRYDFNDIWISQDVVEDKFLCEFKQRVIYKNHIFFLVYQCLNTVSFQSLNYVHVYDIYKSKVYTYNS
jgi:hypothetical protein